MIKNYPTSADYASMTIEQIDHVHQAIYAEIASSPYPVASAQPLPRFAVWQAAHSGAIERISAEIESRGGALAEIDTACHAYVDAHPYYEGVLVAPGVLFEAQLAKPPALTMTERGELAAAIDGDDYTPRLVREVAHLHYHGLVVVSTDAAVFVMTADEWSAQV